MCEPNPFIPLGAPCSFADTTAFDKTVIRDTDSYSLFGLFGWQFADAWKLTLEGRLIYDKVEVSASTADAGADILNPNLSDPANSYIYAGKPGFTDDVSDTNFLPRVTLEYLPSDRLMILWLGSQRHQAAHLQYHGSGRPQHRGRAERKTLDL